MQLKYGSLKDPHETAYNEDDLKSDAPLSLAISREAYETLLRRLVKNGRTNVEFLSGTVTAVHRGKDGSGNHLDRVTIRTESGSVQKDAKFVVGKCSPQDSEIEALRLIRP